MRPRAVAQRAGLTNQRRFYFWTEHYADPRPWLFPSLDPPRKGWLYGDDLPDSVAFDPPEDMLAYRRAAVLKRLERGRARLGKSLLDRLGDEATLREALSPSIQRVTRGIAAAAVTWEASKTLTGGSALAATLSILPKAILWALHRYPIVFLTHWQSLILMAIRSLFQTPRKYVLPRFLPRTKTQRQELH